MIEILPLKDQEKENKILASLNETNKTAKVLMMAEGDADLGYVAVKLMGDTLIYLEFKIYNSENMMPFEKEFYLDTLMRSGASYGENYGADKLETANNLYNDFLKKKGFKTDIFHAFAPMLLIVHYE
ncbi:MAG: hypothetical protein E7564_02570 [Ruminococcaceae bacterium]|nr:hypothetical protein [Oscillospiraceae bacterium]